MKALQLAEASGVRPSIIRGMIASANKPIRADAKTLDKVIHALEIKGVAITEDGVHLVQKPRP